MSQTYMTRQRKPAERQTARPARAAEPAPAAVSGRSAAERGPDPQLEERMQEKFRQHFLDNQIPSAEREADRLSAGLNARTPEEVKTQLGERLGADFSGVRFHTDAGAARAADEIGARAYTSGSDVYFGQGGFDPAVAAHELVHTVQQGQVDSGAATVSAPAGGVQMMPKFLKKIGSLFKRGSKEAEPAPEAAPSVPEAAPSVPESTAVVPVPQASFEQESGPAPEQEAARAPAQSGSASSGKFARLKKLEEAIRVGEEQVAGEQDPEARSRLEINLQRMRLHYDKLKDELGYVPDAPGPAAPGSAGPEAGDGISLTGGEAPKALTYDKAKKPGLFSRAWGAVKRGFSKAGGAIKKGAAYAGGAISDKLNSLKRQHQRAVDDLNHHRADYKAMSRKDRFLWTLKNPLARIMASGSMEDTKARDARAKVLEEKAVALAEREGGGYDLGDAAFDPMQLMEGPGIATSVERDKREAEASRQLAVPALMGPEGEAESETPEAPIEGYTGTASLLQDDVFHGKPKTILSAGSPVVGFGTDSLTNVARARDKLPGIQEEMNQYLAAAGHSENDSEYTALEQTLKDQQDVANLTGGERAFGIGSGLFQMGAAGLEASGNIMKAHSQRKKGDTAGAASHSFYTMSNLADFGIGLSKVAGFASAAPDVVGTVGKEVIPGLGIASGGMKAIGGGVQLGTSLRTKKKMDDRIKAMDDAQKKGAKRTRDQERMYRTFKQASGMAKANAVEGGIKLGSGVLNATGSAMTLGGVTAIAGTIVSGIGTAADLAGGLVVDKMKKGVRTDTVNEEIGLDEKIKALMAQDDSITEREAKHIVLKSMGFSSGKRKEAFQHITMRWAAELYQRANGGDREAEDIVQELGLSKTGGVYSLQGIAEKLGMDSNTPWQEQMKATKESRGHNPFKNKKKAA